MRLAVIALALVLVCLVGSGSGSKRKYAPSYCLRLKFNCASAQKKKHVCCLYPLPIQGNGLITESPESLGSDAAGVQRIRPLRLPSRSKPASDDPSNSDSSGSVNHERYDVFNQKKKKPILKKVLLPFAGQAIMHFNNQP